MKIENRLGHGFKTIFCDKRKSLTKIRNCFAIRSFCEEPNAKLLKVPSGAFFIVLSKGDKLMKRSSRRWKKKRQMRWKWQRKRMKREKRRRIKK